MQSSGIATPIPTLPAVGRPLDVNVPINVEFKLLEDDVGFVLAMPVPVVPMTSVIAADFGSVNVDVKGL
jgi:hypothetical protein